MMRVDRLDTLGYPEPAQAAAFDEALVIVDVGPVAAALIDINLGETKGWPVADALAERGIPFAFTSGGGDAIPPVHAHRRLVTKPFRLREIEPMLPTLFSASGGFGCLD